MVNVNDVSNAQILMTSLNFNTHGQLPAIENDWFNIKLLTFLAVMHREEQINYPFCQDSSKYEKICKIGQGTFG